MEVGKIKIINTRLNHIVNPLGYQYNGLSFSWITESEDAKKQIAARIIIAKDKSMENILFDSGKDRKANSVDFTVSLELEAYTRYYWTVTVWNEKEECATSDINWFETAKLKDPWKANWITGKNYEESQLLIRQFQINKEVKSARAYVCGLGIYELELNGKKVGDEVLAPGYHAYDFWLQYQTYDITSHIQIGKNVVGAMLGNGWYRGRLGFRGGYTNLYGDKQGLICEIHLSFKDGSKEIIYSNEQWKSAPSPVQFSNIYDGEIYDATKEIENWSKSDCTYRDWQEINIYDLGTNKLQERLNLPIEVMERRKAIEIIITPKGETVLDFGQNMAGWVEFTNRTPKNTKVVLQYGEILQDGCFYRENLRSAKAEHIYISNGKDEKVRPHFTFYGFRYVKIEGMDVKGTDFEACAIYSKMEETGSIETGNTDINRLVLNSLWGQKSNFLDVPTDCPQRDERLGWTGDAQIFSGTACFNMYTPVFFNKWMKDMEYEQSVLEGAVPHIVPRIKPKDLTGYIDGYGASPWADSAVIIPWNLYLYYGDKTMLANHYNSMKSWIDYVIKIDKENGDYKRWTSGFHFADWLALDNYENPDSPLGATDSLFVASAFYYHVCNIVGRAANVIGKQEESIYYLERANKIKKSIQEEYFSPNGKCTISTQTALTLTIHLGLLPSGLLERTGKELVQKLEKSNNHLNTGFVGTPYICFALSEMGYDHYAYQLLLNEGYPSWLYQVKMGATTIWERWDSVLPNSKINEEGMNSLNHYAYGSIVEWIYKRVCGISPMEDYPGFKKANIRPHIDKRLGHAKAMVKTAAGNYESGWKVLDDGGINIDIKVPFDCEAYLSLPNTNIAKVYFKNDKVALKQEGTSVSAVLLAGAYDIIYYPVDTKENK